MLEDADTDQALRDIELDEGITAKKVSSSFVELNMSKHSEDSNDHEFDTSNQSSFAF